MIALPSYFSYLLRIWLAGDGQEPQWRASLEDPRTGEVTGFERVEDLVEFLKDLTGLPQDEGEETA